MEALLVALDFLALAQKPAIGNMLFEGSRAAALREGKPDEKRKSPSLILHDCLY
jgi:hypothetical protein